MAVIGGKYWGIPGYYPYVGEAERSPMYRKDFLNRLGIMQDPATLDEFKAALVAFAKADLDGNGKRDTYAYGVP